MKCLAAFLFATLAAGSTGCTGTECNLKGVPQGLQFEIDSGPTAADYELQFEHANGLLKVDYAVMPDGKVKCLEGCEDRDADFRVDPSAWSADSFTSNMVVLAVTGAEHVHDLPHELHLTVLRDAVAVYDQVYTPVYKHSEPWGDGCGESVTSHVKLTLP